MNNPRMTWIITGGIAAVKIPDLVHRFVKEGVHISTILTANGGRFVTPESLTALTGVPPATSLWETRADGGMPHIRLARDADLIVVAPATAHTLARMAHGLADDLATTVLLATTAPILVAPAMNVAMWENAATQHNLACLRARGVEIVDPDAGVLACGEVGHGRMADSDVLYARIMTCLARKPVSLTLKGVHALVTSGPTFEPIDPVRFLGNRSSGRQGHALAVALARRGARVTLVTGPVALPDPTGVTTLHVQTAREMKEACATVLPADLVIAAAAVADWGIANPQTQKIKKTAEQDTPPTITLVPNPDILAWLSHEVTPRPRLVIGFAAESENLAAYATHKLIKKGCDWIVANSVAEGASFGDVTRSVTLVKRTDLHQGMDAGVAQELWPSLSKADVAERLVDEIVGYWGAGSPVYF